MLRDAKVTTALPAQDLDRARSFYSEKLGLEPAEVVEGGTGLQYEMADGTFLVFASSGRSSGSHTQMAFHVADADAVASELRSRGVVFEDVEGVEQQGGIATMETVRGGWFKDSEGNLLGIVEHLD